MKTLDNYMGIEPFTVLVDDAPELRQLAGEARELKTLPFQDKLAGVKKLSLGAMVNAYEQMVVWERKTDELKNVVIINAYGERDNSEYEAAKKQYEKFREIVFQKHPLSHALEQRAGCCRYQGALFFVLGYEAGLGDQHFVQGAPVSRGVNTVFNEIVQDGQRHKVSIFTNSLEDKELDYSRQNPQIFEQAFNEMYGFNFYSYHKTPSGLIIVENPDRHVKVLIIVKNINK